MANELKPPRMYPATEGQAKAVLAILGLLFVILIGWLVIYGPGLRAVHGAISD